MLPFVEIGSWQVSTYYLVYLVAITVAGTLAVRRLSRAGVPWHWPVEGMAAVILGGMLGAAAFWWLLGGIEWLLTGDRVWFGGPGSTVLGAITAGAATGAAYCRWRGVSIGRAFDRGVPALPLGQGIGRLGCLLAGCCYGKPTDSWLGLDLPGEGGVWCRRYPTQLLSSLADFAIFAVLLAVDRHAGGHEGERERRLFPGDLASLYAVLYFSKRFAMEFLRAERPLVWGPLTWAHLVSAAGLLVVAVLRVANRRRAAGGAGRSLSREAARARGALASAGEAAGRNARRRG